MRKVIGVILILGGICLIGFALYNRIYYDNINNTLVEYYEDEYSQYTTEKDFFEENSEIISEVLVENTTEYTVITQKDVTEGLPVDVIGVISIKKIGLKAAIAEGSDYYTIKYSVGHFENTPLPADGGNFCVLGHRSYTYGQFFNRVDDLEIGDLIDVNVKGVAYSYQIYDIYETKATDMSVLDNGNKNEITIVTCTKDGSKRVIVKGLMLEYK